MLSHCFRQSQDLGFASVLNEIRIGLCSTASRRILSSRTMRGSDDDDEDCEEPWLVSRNDTADGINHRRLAKLEGSEMSYRATDSFYRLRQDISNYKALEAALAYAIRLEKPLDWAMKTCLFPQNLVLKVGARVMLLKNLNVEEGLCNGAMGTVNRLYANGVVVVQFDKNPENLQMISQQKWSRCWKETQASAGWKYRIAVRQQIPLRLCWAISIHKSQGMTLESARVDLSRTFEKGQVYVALSRLQTLSGLKIRGFKPWKIHADPKVIEFYRSLSDHRCVDCGNGMPLSAQSQDKFCDACLEIYKQSFFSE